MAPIVSIWTAVLANPNRNLNDHNNQHQKKTPAHRHHERGRMVCTWQKDLIQGETIEKNQAGKQSGESPHGLSPFFCARFPVRIDKRIYNSHTYYMHTTTAQNLTHRTDLTWIKKGRTYSRFDGVSILKDNNTGRWNIYLANGDRAPKMIGGKASAGNMSAHNLTWAKLDAAQIGA